MPLPLRTAVSAQSVSWYVNRPILLDVYQSSRVLISQCLRSYLGKVDDDLDLRLLLILFVDSRVFFWGGGSEGRGESLARTYNIEFWQKEHINAAVCGTFVINSDDGSNVRFPNISFLVPIPLYVLR